MENIFNKFFITISKYKYTKYAMIKKNNNIFRKYLKYILFT